MSEQNDWNGRERRKGHDRRQAADRREDIRFEPGKSDRRQSRGRRKEDQDPWHKSLND
ncbi:hypothetical protein H9C73_04455 [Marinobacterium sp. AK62]|uniref:Uncharacterized protein n=1 Tax=Marinobacterium alkalitolerans TaxID=1542925 RepID=A0ABS3Z8F0_9GAMM|nr:hypothetical protein [Marinobacterium alkalitolerans]MBP0047975.1 hypothetical protein [Marinobacterium alkalitolerans]